MPAEAGSRRRTSSFSLAAEIGLWTLVFFCPLALGGAPEWTLWPFCAVAGASLVLACEGARRQGQGLRVPLLAWAFVLSAALCLLQLVPLPGPLLGALSPEAAELRDFALAPLGLTRARPVSLDPPATWRALALGLGCLAVLLAAAQVSRSRKAQRRLVMAVALSGVLVAAIGVAHLLLGLRALFGAYAFHQAEPPLLTPFGNANHLAAFLLLSGTLALGLATSAERRQEALGWGGCFLLTGTGVLLSFSRGGIFFFAVALLLFGGMLLLTRARGRRGAGPSRAAGAIQVLVASAAVVAVGAYLALERLLGELATADSLEKLRASKLELWPMLAAAASKFSRLGMGRGAFEPAFPRYQTEFAGFTFSHPENGVLQLWSELGLPAAAAVLGLLLAGVYRLARRATPTRVDLAIMAAAVGLGLHNLVDFNLELPACAAALCLALGVLGRPDEAREGLRVPARWALGGAGAALGLALAALALGRHTLADGEARLAAALASGATPGQVRDVALELIDQHPADFLPHAVVARAYAGKGGDARQALAFVNRALYLRPLDGEAHRTAARSLLRLGKRNQALAEYRLAARGEGGTAALAEAVAQARGEEELTRLTPPEPGAVHEVADQLWGQHRGDEAVALLEWATRTLEARDAGRAWIQLATVRTARREFPRALEALEQAERLLPDAAEPVLARVGVLAAQGKPAEAVALLDARVVRQPGNVELSFALAEQEVARKEPRRALAALERASPFVASPGQRGRMMGLQGQAYEAMGRPAKALEAYQSAARLEPGSAGLHYIIARLYEGMSKQGEAAREVREGMRRDSAAGAEAARAWAARLEEEEKRAREGRKVRALSEQERLDLELLQRASSPAP